MKRMSCFILSLLLLMQMVINILPVAAKEVSDNKDAIAESSLSVSEKGNSYNEYRKTNENAGYPQKTISIDTKDVFVKEKEPAKVNLSVEDAGWYQIAITYEADASKGNDIQLSLLIDNKLPFEEAEGILLSRLWKEILPENSDYSAPAQEQVTGSQTAMISAGNVYSNEASFFYFSKGKHSLTFESQRGTIKINNITLCQPKEVPTYKEYLDSLKKEGKTPENIDVKPQYLEGESVSLKSHASVKSIADYSSCITRPYDVRSDLINTFGGDKWSGDGQWGEWKFETKKAGFYKLYFRYKQNYKSGTYVVRRLMLDGEVPFKEADSIEFKYDLDWCVSALGGNKPLYIYLEPGEHTLRLEVTYGNLDELLSEVQSCLDEMNILYRNIMMITGASPDSQRDYDIEIALPDTPKQCGDLSKRLYAVINKLVKNTGSKGSETAMLEKMAIQLSEFSADVETIPQRLSAFNSNISSLASWLITTKQQPLLLDYIQVAPIEEKAPVANAKWYQSVWNEIVRFFISFIEDYDSISTSASAEEDPVTIWLGIGRDQALVLNHLIRNGFTVEKGIPVNLRLIGMESLMPAVASNVGPDVALFQDQATVINYALRNAIYDLNDWKDINDVKERFYDEALQCYTLGDSLYGLPENTSCYVMYYRKDIFAELGLTVPETWEDLYKVITVLEKNKLEFGIPSSFTTTTTTMVSPVFLSMLYQNGGQVYDEAREKCILDNSIGINAFNEFCELHTKYGVALKIDLLTRFRTGQAPLVLNAFTFSNELSVSAPEISGLWDMVMLPGTEKQDGTIDHSTLMTCSGTVMFKNARNKENAWEFLKWWTRADAQSGYAEAIEASLGQSGRWNSANKEALSNSAYSVKELDVIKAQLAQAKALPEAAGGYYTGRSINNAIRTVVTSYEEPKETLYEYVTDINKELSQKRKELGLD